MIETSFVLVFCGRILSIFREAESSITLEDITKKHQVPSTHALSSKYAVQSITLGKLEVTTEALRVALQKLESGDSIEDAKAVCGPGLLTQITKWRVSIPFLFTIFIECCYIIIFHFHLLWLVICLNYLWISCATLLNFNCYSIFGLNSFPICLCVSFTLAYFS